MPYDVHPICAWTDNYIWAICPRSNNHCYVVDPGQAAPVKAFLSQHNRILKGILITHHHLDHTGGVSALMEDFACKVYGNAAMPLPELNHPIHPGDRIFIEPDLPLDTLPTPGHTLDHIVYFDPQHLFCGDVLFNIGCGKLFEGSAQMGYDSLMKLAALPKSIQIYPAHEYTLDNLAFARHVEPQHPDLEAYHTWAQEQRAKNKPTLPTPLQTQCELNPFLRCDTPSIKQAVEQYSQQTTFHASEVFAQLRTWKDNLTQIRPQT